MPGKNRPSQTPEGRRKRPSNSPEARRQWREKMLAARKAAGDLYGLPECSEPRERESWCKRHHSLWQYSGDPRGIGRGGGQQVRGVQHGMAKLTAAKVLEIRERHAAGESQGALAREFGVSGPNVNSVVWGRTCQHVGGPLRVTRTPKPVPEPKPPPKPKPPKRTRDELREARRRQREKRLAARKAAGDLCEVCDEPRLFVRWCGKHYMRWKRTGDPLGITALPRTVTPGERC